MSQVKAAGDIISSVVGRHSQVKANVQVKQSFESNAVTQNTRVDSRAFQTTVWSLLHSLKANVAMSGGYISESFVWKSTSKLFQDDQFISSG